MRIMGFDPSLNGSAWCCLDTTDQSFEIGGIPVKNLKGIPRLLYVKRKFGAILQSYAPDLLVYEGYAMGGKGRVFDIGELGGILKLFALELGVPLLLVPPTNLKQFTTGKGNAGKPEMIAAVLSEWGHVARDDDQADAFALAKFGHAHKDRRAARGYSDLRRTALTGAQFYPSITLQTIATQTDGA